MHLHHIHKKIVLPIPREEAWDFFSNPHNLAKITPKELGLNVNKDIPEKIYPGMIISYKINPFPGISSLWVTELKHIIEGKQFVDEQRFGPYKFWHHLHRIHHHKDGTEVEDMVYYAVPFELFGGNIVHTLIIRNKLENIFKYREEVLQKLFSKT